MDEIKNKDIQKYIRKIDKITDAKEGELVIVNGKIKDTAVKLSPKLSFPDEYEGEIYDGGFSGDILDIKFDIHDGYLIKRTEGKKNSIEHAEEFNLVISFFNILGIPLDFVSIADIILFAEDPAKHPFIAPFSTKAERRGKEVTIDVTPEESAVLHFALFYFKEKMKRNKITELLDNFKFLGYTNYYMFHHDYHLSFINSWMFIEPVINYLWNEAVTEKIGMVNTSPTKHERDWTMQHKIDELFMLDKIKEWTRERLQILRTKRNKVFHVDKRKHKRKVDFKDAEDCIKMAMMLFYKLLDNEEGNILVFNKIMDIRNKIGEATFGPHSSMYKKVSIKKKKT